VSLNAYIFLEHYKKNNSLLLLTKSIDLNFMIEGLLLCYIFCLKLRAGADKKTQYLIGGENMNTSVNIKAKACCVLEKKRLMEELKVCDNDTTSPEERHLCIRKAARRSGQRSKNCLI